MVHSAYEVHDYLGHSPRTFDGYTQALTVAFNGEDLHIYANHRSQDGKYHSYPVSAEKTSFSLSQYGIARRQLRNAQEWGRARAEQICQEIWGKVGRDETRKVGNKIPKSRHGIKKSTRPRPKR
jgi:hypothetical protein